MTLNPRLIIGLLLLLAVVTELTFTDTVRFEQVGDNQLVNPAFIQQLNGWTSNMLSVGGELSGGTATLHNSVGGKNFLRQRVAVPEGIEWVLVTMDVMTRGVRQGEKSWQKARVNLVQFDSQENLIKNSVRLNTLLEGDHPWHPSSVMHQLHPEARFVSLLITLNGATGSMSVRDPSLIWARESVRFSLLYWTTASLWIISGITLAVWLICQPPLPARLLLITLILGSQFLLLSPMNLPDSLARQVVELMASLKQSAIEHISTPPSPPSPAPKGAKALGTQPDPSPKAEPSTSPPQVMKHTTFTLTRLPGDKLGHILLFILLSLGGVLARGRYDLVRVTLALVAYATLTELLQHYTLEREPDLSDLSFNLLGIALVMLPLLLVRTLRRRYISSRLQEGGGDDPPPSPVAGKS